jgi:opacity protein-like surface antigen
MKYLSAITALAVSLTMAAHAGTIDNKAVIAPAIDYGTGLYLAPEAGLNLYHATPDAGRPGIGGRKVDTGGFVGGKVGYVFGTGLIRPALEGDMFYNRFGGGWDRVFRGAAGHRHKEYQNYQINSGAFIENELVRLNLGKLQPYVGGGMGVYTANTSRQQTDTNFYSGRKYSYSNFHSNNTSLAWQLVAGTDYYVTQKLAVFAEYKYLNYMDTAPHNRLSQQLLGAGVRFQF